MGHFCTDVEKNEREIFTLVVSVRVSKKSIECFPFVEDTSAVLLFFFFNQNYLETIQSPETVKLHQ